MVIATACYVGFGWRHVLLALGWFDVCALLHLSVPSKPSSHRFPFPQEPWPHLAPPISFLMTYLLAAVLCMAVTAMGGWHLWMIACGETSVESQDNEQYRRFASRRGEVSSRLL